MNTRTSCSRNKKFSLAGIRLSILIVLVLTACTSTIPGPVTSLPVATPTTEPRTLRIMTHDSFAISEAILAVFEAENEVKVQFVKSGDVGTALNKAILSKDNPLADVFYGVDNTFLSRALTEGIFEAYNSPGLAGIPDEFKLDAENRALPVDYGDVCLNYDKAYFAKNNLQLPVTLDDLLKPEYKSLLVVENPATSSPGLAFLLTTIGNYGDPGFLDYWKKLVHNDVLVVDGWETAYNTEFSGAAGKGARPIVVSYNSSPAFEVIYAEPPVEQPSSAAIVSPKTCFRQIEFVGILKGNQNRDLAEKWVDFMLSKTFQEDLALQMFVFPVNPQAKLAETFTKFLQQPQETANSEAAVSPANIAAKREVWLKAWTEAVLR